jgi:hypothetical protein
MRGDESAGRRWLLYQSPAATQPSIGAFQSAAEIRRRLANPLEASLPRFFPGPFSIVLVLLAGCSPTRIESAHFGPPSAIEQAIRRYYERHASEEGARCFRPYIDGFSRISVLEDTPDRLVVQTRYFFRDRAQDGGPGGGSVCAGFNERTFTLARDQDGRPAVTNMTGEQYEPAIRSLIRRMLPG